MAINTLVSRGYGNGTYSGTIPLVVRRGNSAGVAILLPKLATVFEDMRQVGRSDVIGSNHRRDLRKGEQTTDLTESP